MRRLFSLLRSRWALGLLGVACFGLLVWFYGPLLAFNGHEPFEREAVRWAWILGAFGVWAVCLLWHWIRARLDSRRLVEGIAGKPEALPGERESAAEIAALAERMRQAMALLRKSRPGGKPLARLPWYLFIGPPGSGKTMALLQSGLNFPLAGALGAGAVGGVGGTRNCDWWFADEAVLLDTAGRYTTQDSDPAADRAAWFGFLDLLRKHRRHRPVNGVIVTVSMAELLACDEAALQAQARAVRERLRELQERLRIRIPVYVMVTKCDLLAGFCEFFEAMGREERAQVWGVSFSGAQADSVDAALKGFGAEFDALEHRLQEQLLQRLQQERDIRRRALIYSFPQQFAGMREEISRFLVAAFQPSSYEEAVMLRGVYFTSGTQEGNPVDRVMSAMARSLGLDSDALPPNLTVGRAYFITRLLREVILPEADLASGYMRFGRRRLLLHRAALAAIVLALLLVWAGQFVSYGRNRATVAQVAAAAGHVGDMARALPTSAELPAVLPLLDAARAIPGGYAQRDEGVPLLNRFGLYQGDKLGDAAQTLYRRLLRDALAPRLVARIEEALRRGDADGQDYLYESLRVYLMLGDGKRLQAESVQAWAELDARRNLPARVYQRLLRAPAILRLPDFSLADAAGPGAPLVFVRASGQELGEGIAGIYTVAGYRSLLGELDGVINDLAGEGWVLGAQGYGAPGEQRAATRDATLQLYYADYIARWDALLADIRIVPLSSLDQAARVLTLLSGPESPLRSLVRAAARETTLESGEAGKGASRGIDEMVNAKLQAAQKRLKAALGSAAAVAAPADGNINPVDLHFQDLHKLAGGNAGAAPIEQTLAVLKDVALYFDAANGARRAGTAAPASDALTRLRRDMDGKPPMVAGMLKSVESSGAILALGNERQRLSALWSTSAQFCREAIAQRYPLARGATQEVTLDDFARFFAPGGMIDDFFAKNLAPYVDMSGAQWRWRASSEAPPAVSAQTLGNFQRAARIRDMFFAAGGRQPLLRFELKPTNMDPALTRVDLDIDGQAISYGVGSQPQTLAVQLPSGKGVGQVRLQAASGGELRTSGPWAWFRMMDRGQLEASGQGERYLLSFAFDGRKVVYELTASSVINPFRRDALEQFQCPERL